MDFSMPVPKAAGKKAQPPAAAQYAPPPLAPRQEYASHGGFGAVSPYMGGYMSNMDELSRVRRLNNIELTHSRNLRMNFGEHKDDVDDRSYAQRYLHYGYNQHGNRQESSASAAAAPPAENGLAPPRGYPPPGFFYW